MTGTDQSVGRAVPEHILSLEQIIKVIGRTRMEIMLSLSTFRIENGKRKLHS